MYATAWINKIAAIRVRQPRLEGRKKHTNTQHTYQRIQLNSMHIRETNTKNAGETATRRSIDEEKGMDWRKRDANKA